MGVVPVAAMHVVGGVHAPMLIAEAEMLLIPVDQPFTCFLWDMGFH